MKYLRTIFAFLAPAAVVGTLVLFVYYALVLYKPAEHRTCGASAVARQTDVAVHVVRQWFGKEGQAYTGCQEPGQ